MGHLGTLQARSNPSKQGWTGQNNFQVASQHILYLPPHLSDRSFFFCENHGYALWGKSKVWSLGDSLSMKITENKWWEFITGCAGICLYNLNVCKLYLIMAFVLSLKTSQGLLKGSEIFSSWPWAWLWAKLALCQNLVSGFWMMKSGGFQSPFFGSTKISSDWDCRKKFPWGVESSEISQAKSGQQGAADPTSASPLAGLQWR